MYVVHVPTQGKKARLNLTIDQDLYAASKVIFPALGLNMSNFVEMQLANFLHMAEPLRELLSTGDPAPAQVKAALHAFSSRGMAAMGGALHDGASAFKDIQEVADALENIQIKK